MSSAKHVPSTAPSRTATARRGSRGSAAGISAPRPDRPEPALSTETRIALLFRQWVDNLAAWETSNAKWDAGIDLDEENKQADAFTDEDGRLLAEIAMAPATSAADVRLKMQVYRDLVELELPPYLPADHVTLDEPFLAGIFADVERMLPAGDPA